MTEPTITVYRSSFHNPITGCDGEMEVYPGMEHWRAKNATTGTPFPGMYFGTAQAGRDLVEDLLLGWGWEQNSEWAAVEIQARKGPGREEGQRVQVRKAVQG